MRKLLTGIAALAAATALVAGTGTAASAATGTASRAASYTLATTSAGSQTLVMRWNPCQAAITYAVNVAGAGRSAKARRSAVADTRRAVTELAAATGMTFAYTGTTSFVPTGSDWAATAPAEIVIAWIDGKAGRTSTLLQTTSDGMAVAATGGFSYKRWSTDGSTWDGVIGRGFVVVNAHTPTVVPGYGAGITRGNLLLHELGHVVGLQHTDDTGQIMNPVLLPRSASGYRSGDLGGLARLGTDAGCITAPAGVFTDL